MINSYREFPIRDPFPEAPSYLEMVIAVLWPTLNCTHLFIHYGICTEGVGPAGPTHWTLLLLTQFGAPACAAPRPPSRCRCSYPVCRRVLPRPRMPELAKGLWLTLMLLLLLLLRWLVRGPLYAVMESVSAVPTCRRLCSPMYPLSDFSNFQSMLSRQRCRRCLWAHLFSFSFHNERCHGRQSASVFTWSKRTGGWCGLGGGGRCSLAVPKTQPKCSHSCLKLYVYIMCQAMLLCNDFVNKCKMLR